MQLGCRATASTFELLLYRGYLEVLRELCTKKDWYGIGLLKKVA